MTDWSFRPTKGNNAHQALHYFFSNLRIKPNVSTSELPHTFSDKDIFELATAQGPCLFIATDGDQAENADGTQGIAVAVAVLCQVKLKEGANFEDKDAWMDKDVRPLEAWINSLPEKIGNMATNKHIAGMMANILAEYLIPRGCAGSVIMDLDTSRITLAQGS